MRSRRFREKFETTPLVVDGIMYLTVPPNEAYALDAETGVVLWEYKRSLPPKIIVCCGQVNRGLAIQGDRLFMATLDAMVIALDRKTGRLLWESDMIDYKLGYAATHAPLVVKDKVIVGVAGGEYGIRGFIDAYNGSTPFPDPANSATTPGKETLGRRAALRSGSPVPTIPLRT